MPAFEQWWQWKRHGIAPLVGGWRDQPLPFLVRSRAMSFVHDTFEMKSRKDFHWNEFSPAQRDLVTMIEKMQKEMDLAVTNG